MQTLFSPLPLRVFFQVILSYCHFKFTPTTALILHEHQFDLRPQNTRANPEHIIPLAAYKYLGKKYSVQFLPVVSEQVSAQKSTSMVTTQIQVLLFVGSRQVRQSRLCSFSFLLSIRRISKTRRGGCQLERARSTRDEWRRKGK